MAKVQIGTFQDTLVEVDANSVKNVDWMMSDRSEYVTVSFNANSEEHTQYGESVFLDRAPIGEQSLMEQVEAVKKTVFSALTPTS